MSIKMMFNGIKVEKKLFRGNWHFNHNDGSISFYSKTYEDLPEAVRSMFTVKNATELVTDYFEKDHFTVAVGHEMYKAVAQACAKNTARRLPRYIAKCNKWYNGNISEATKGDIRMMERELEILAAA